MTEMTELNEVAILEQLSLFLLEKCAVHFDLKDGTFYNGDIIAVKENYVLIDEVKLGRTPVIYKDLAKMPEIYHKKDGGKNENKM